MTPPSRGRLPRRQLIVAPRLQGRLLGRVLLYCLASAVASCGTLLALRATVGGTPVGPSLVLLAVAVGAVVWAAMYDAARISNQMVGPFVRVHGLLRRLCNGEPVAPMSVRGDDSWSEWIRDFNTLAARLQRQQQLEQRQQAPAPVEQAPVEQLAGQRGDG